MSQTVQILLAACGTIVALGGLFFLLLGNRIGEIGNRIDDLVTVVGRLDTRLGAVEERVAEVRVEMAGVKAKLDQHDAEFRDMRRGDR